MKIPAQHPCLLLLIMILLLIRLGAAPKDQEPIKIRSRSAAEKALFPPTP